MRQNCYAVTTTLSCLYYNHDMGKYDSELNVTTIPPIYTIHNSFVNFVKLSKFHIFKCCHITEGFVLYLYTVISLSYILTRNKNILSFFCPHFRRISFLICNVNL
jgi:hypothetical protein